MTLNIGIWVIPAIITLFCAYKLCQRNKNTFDVVDLFREAVEGFSYIIIITFVWMVFFAFMWYKSTH